MLIGYAKASSIQHDLDRQLHALRAAGCETVFADATIGQDVKGRPELENAISALNRGDVLVMAEWVRATRSMFDGIAIIQRVCSLGATIKVLDKPQLDLATKNGQGFLAVLSALADGERERIARHALEGQRAASKNGAKLGRKPKLAEHQLSQVRAELALGRSCRSIAQDLNVHHSTISRLR